MRIALVIFMILLTGALGWLLGWQYHSSNSTPDEESAAMINAVAAEQPRAIHAQGKLEPSSGIVKIMAPPGEKIDSLFELHVGDQVEIDDPLVQLHSRLLRQKELDLADARKLDAEAKAAFEKEQGEFKRRAADLAVQQARSVHDEINSKSQNIVLLQKQRKSANEVLDRLRRLDADESTRRLINQTDIDKQQLLVDQLDVKIEQTKAEIELANEKADRAQQAARIDLETVQFSLDRSTDAIPSRSLDQAIAAAQLALDTTVIKSPIKGTVLDIIVREGDTVANLPVMLLGDTSQMHCVAEINDSQMRFVKIDAKATISSLALSEPIYGKVKSKGIMIGSPSMKDPNPFGSVDRKTGKVVILLDNPEIARNFVNLQVDVEIELATTASQ